MPRKEGHSRVLEHREGGWFAALVEQGWLAFVVLGVFLLGLRWYNMKQREQQRKLLRGTIMAELGYGVPKPPTAAAVQKKLKTE